jgi:hypothetical protein
MITIILSEESKSHKLLASTDNFLDFVHRPVICTQTTTFRELDLLPSSGDGYLLTWRREQIQLPKRSDLFVVYSKLDNV